VPSREPKADARPVASVVVCAYNARDRIDVALRSLAAQDFEEPWEVVVAASGEDGTAEHVRENWPGVVLTSSPGRLLPGASRNRGVRAARGEYIAFLPDDCVARPDWLRRKVAKHREGYEMVGGAITNSTPWHPVGSAGYFLEYSFLIPSERVLARNSVPHLLSFERALLERVGGYPEDVPTGEDTLLNQRCVRAGARTGFEPAAQFEHRNLKGLGAYLRHQYDHGRGLMVCAERYGYPSPAGPPGGPLRAALRGTFWRYPKRRWVYARGCLRDGRPRWLPAYMALTPLIWAGLWAASAGVWREWRAASARAAARPSQPA
jgi:glycosyltransferase involved in cell wall biosynthesis